MNSGPRDMFIGRTLDGRYRVRSRIARGGMGVVYLADDLRLGRKVAVKAMHPHLVDDDAFVRRFEQEAQAVARLNDQNVVNVFDQGTDGEIPYLVMEYVPGITLRELLKQQRRLTGAQAIEISEAVLRGLSAAHQAGFIHRDIKPENVFLADDGRIKIGDFGLARPAGAHTATAQGLMGTVAYLSPELITRNAAADARSDVYAFGIMLYEMLTGVQPFQGEQALLVANKHTKEDVPKPSLISKESTPELDELVRWATNRNPDLRPKNAAVVLARLEQLLNGGLDSPTRALPQDQDQPTAVLGETTMLLPETKIQAPQQRTAYTPQQTASDIPGGDADGSAISAAQYAARRRHKRGKTTALLVTVVTAVTGFAAWWFGQGPGSQVAVPDLISMDTQTAAAQLTEIGFVPEIKDCTDPEVAVGKVSSLQPAPGSRLDPGSSVAVCNSVGPALLEVPTLVGLTEADAENAVTEAGFTYAGVSSEVFGKEKTGTVVAPLGEDGNALGATYPERGKISFVLAAGPLPQVAGMEQQEAVATLTAARLVVDDSLSTEENSDEVEKGRVIGIKAGSDRVSVEQSVGLIISKGPQLYKVPDVTGKKVNEAIDILREAGFVPKTAVPKLLRNAVVVSETDPAPGTELPAGAEVELGFEL